MTIVIPTFRREEILIQTLDQVLDLRPDEVLVVDQTPHHEEGTDRALAEHDRNRTIRWIRLDKPSIPRAMNTGLLEARNETVLFLDDDIIPSPILLNAHEEAHRTHPDAGAVIGQVLQPGESPTQEEKDFRFSSSVPRWIDSAMAGNMSVKRGPAVAAGGFDENFIGVAYQFETEFARRLIRGGGRVFFEPRASIRHLRAERGGTRSYGTHLRTMSPAHAVGDYYHMLVSDGSKPPARAILHRLRSSVTTRHHLLHPWWIPMTLVAEIRGILQAIRLRKRGARLLGERELYHSENTTS